MTTTPTNPITVAQVRAAIFRILDDGDAARQFGVSKPSWEFNVDDESDEESATRMRFVDAVIARLEEEAQLKKLQGETKVNVPDAMIEAEEKAWRSLAGYKFWMFGYHAAQWVLLNKIDLPFGGRMANPFRKLVQVAREHVKENYDKEQKAA